MSKFSKNLSKKIANYKRKSRFFEIFILKIVKFGQNFAVETLPENGEPNTTLHATFLRGLPNVKYIIIIILIFIIIIIIHKFA